MVDFSAREVAEAMGTTTAAVNSALQRARRLGCYAWEEGARIAEVTACLVPEILESFGLPSER